MKDAIINIKVDSKEKKKAQKIAADLGFSLSSIMNAYLKDFIRKERVDASLETAERLSDFAERQIEDSKGDYQAGRYMEFDNDEEELAWLDNVIRDAEKKKNSR